MGCLALPLPFNTSILQSLWRASQRFPDWPSAMIMDTSSPGETLPRRSAVVPNIIRYDYIGRRAAENPILCATCLLGGRCPRAEQRVLPSCSRLLLLTSAGVAASRPLGRLGQKWESSVGSIFPDQAVDLIRLSMHFNPTKRASAAALLKHPSPTLCIQGAAVWSVNFRVSRGTRILAPLQM